MQPLAAIHEQPNCLPPLPDDIISEINTLVNQNQLYIELLASKHCEIKLRLNATRGYEDKELHFSRRRDLRFLFECGEQILGHFLERTHNELSPQTLDRRMSLSVKHYIRNLLDSFAESAEPAPPLSNIDDDKDSLVSDAFSTRSFTSSEAMSITSSISGSISSRYSSKEREAVYDGDDGVEVQLECFVPSVSFSDSVECIKF